MKEMNGETKAEEVSKTERVGSNPRARRVLVVAGVAAFAVVAVAVWSWFARMTAAGGVVTLRQTAVAPGRFPLVVRTYELSNGCARPLAFYRPDAQFHLFGFQTFVTNDRAPHGCWESSPNGGGLAARHPRPIWIPAGGTASFSLELPDDRRPRRLLVPLFENAFFHKRCAVTAVSEGPENTPDEDVAMPDYLWEILMAQSSNPYLLGCDPAGTFSLNGLPAPEPDIRERLEEQQGRLMSVAIDADDTAPLRHLVRLYEMSCEGGIMPAIVTDSGPVQLPNTMGEEWRLGDFENPEIENADDLAKTGPFAPAVVRFDGADIYVNGVLCPETNLVERLAEASDDGARPLRFLWKGDEGNDPCRSFKRVLAAYHDIGGAWPFTFL